MSVLMLSTLLLVFIAVFGGIAGNVTVYRIFAAAALVGALCTAGISHGTPGIVVATAIIAIGLPLAIYAVANVILWFIWQRVLRQFPEESDASAVNFFSISRVYRTMWLAE